jgi:rSAM/selenodomain-associated transferase 2
MAEPFMSATGPLLSIVVPVRGDSAPLGALLAQLPSRPGVQIIVSATGPSDAAAARIRAARADVHWIDGPAGRGVQFNAGAAAAIGRWLWFVHADSRLPAGWFEGFEALDAREDVVGGAFAFRLDSGAWQARWLERAVAARVRLFGLPYGDQGIFVRRGVFNSLRGFLPIPLMEDVDFVRRLKRQGRVVHLSEGMVTSPRRWEQRGWLRQSLSNLGTLTLYFLGVSPERLARRYDRRPNVF